jgi:hypothetical protein
MSFFGNLEEFAADLYPYRWPITLGLMAALAAFLVMAYYRGWHLVVWRYKLASGIAAIAIVAVTVPLGNYLLSPLWERSHLEEASPLASAPGGVDSSDPPGGPTAGAPPPSPGASQGDPAFEPSVARSGVFSGADDFHFGEGNALLIETEPGVYTLRFEEFSVRNGPDLFVYLASDENSVDGAINLGELKATDGAFNYEVPAGTDVAQYQYAIVWCRQFEVLFASAPLDGA